MDLLVCRYTLARFGSSLYKHAGPEQDNLTSRPQATPGRPPDHGLTGRHHRLITVVVYRRRRERDAVEVTSPRNLLIDFSGRVPNRTILNRARVKNGFQMFWLGASQW